MGANRLIRLGAARGAMLEHRASVATPPRGRFVAPAAGFFCTVAALRPFADAQASPCGARLATAQKKSRSNGFYLPRTALDTRNREIGP